jgi:hypothetical protein
MEGTTLLLFSSPLKILPHRLRRWLFFYRVPTVGWKVAQSGLRLNHNNSLCLQEYLLSKDGNPSAIQDARRDEKFPISFSVLHPFILAELRRGNFQIDHE